MTRVMVYDDTDDSWLEASWRWGARLYRMRNEIDGYAGIRSLTDMVDFVTSFERVDELQFWGHGWFGHFVINKVWHGKKELAGQLFTHMSSVLHPDSLVWFRTCGTFGGRWGHEFAVEAAKRFGCRVAGYTHLIGAWQSGLHTLSPSELPRWPVDEGLKGSPSKPALVGSSPWRPNTIFCTQSDIPAGW